MLTPATPAMAHSKADLAQARSDAAHQWLQNVNTPTEMRVDGTRIALGKATGAS